MILGPNRIEQWLMSSILSLAAVLVIFLVIQRVFIYENQKQQIEIAFPEAALISATIQDPQAPAKLLASGVTTLVRKPYTLDDMINYKLAKAWQVEPDLMHIYLEDNKLTGNAVVFLTGQLGMNAVSMNIKDDGYVFEVTLPGPMEQIDPNRFILEISTGPMPAGFRRALYLPAGDWGQSRDLDQLTQSIYSLKPDIVIPDWLGGLNAGYFYQSYLQTSWLRKPIIALPESHVPWQGKWALRRQKTHHLIRTHNITAEEMTKLSGSRLKNRLVRAVVERSINMLYFEQPAAWSFDQVLAVSAELKSALIKRGITIGPITMPRMVRIGHIAINIIYLALTVILFTLIWQAAIWIAGVTGKNDAIDRQLTIKLKPNNFRWISMFFLIGLLTIHWQGNMVWSTKISALLLAIITPLVSLSYIPKIYQPKERYSRLLLLGLKDFSSLTVWNIMAGLAIAVLLYQPGFKMRIDTFFGVKLAFALPLILGFIYLFPAITDSQWWKRRLAPGHWPWTVLAVSTMLLILTYMVVRSGNHSWLPVSSFEYGVREWLESSFVARPRFKEFLIGHPLLLIGLAAGRLPGKRAEVWSKYCIALGLIGQISIINTFCHIHTPLLISLARTVNGLGLGLLLGALVLIPITIYNVKEK